MTGSLGKLYEQLGIVNKSEFHAFDGFDFNANINFSLRYKNALNEMKPEAFFLLDSEPFILFFNLENSLNASEELQRIHRQSWNFDKAPIIVVSTSNEIVFYNAFDFNEETSELAKLTHSKKDFEAFAYENLYNGSLFEKYKNKFIDKNRVNVSLLNHITDYRQELIDSGLDASVANSLLSRIIFLRYLKDREIIVDNAKNQKIDEGFESKKKLYSLFKYLKEQFNGDLFIIEQGEEKLITDNHFQVLNSFYNNAAVTGQQRLFPFDFSIIPVELVSNIYENFFNEKRDENKAYYTPTFLVDYMINKTISKFLSDKNKKDSNCKILDPACGSGIFLIETLRKIIQKEELLNKKQKITAQKLNELVENNIFGVDKDENAINIAVFSLYITMLDYQSPRSMLTFKFPKLKDKNFFVSDFFDNDNVFNSKIKNVDFILSNPPYGSIKKGKHSNWSKNNAVPISDNQIAQSFLARAKDFCSDDTVVSMVVTSKILYNLKADAFRKYFLENFRLNEVFELSPVRKQIFSGAIPPVSVITYQYSEKNDLGNDFKHISIKPNLFFKYFKTLLIEKNDEKIVSQGKVYKYDWLWKTLLYGNILDFYFIKRLKENFCRIERDNDIWVGQGLIINGDIKTSNNFDTTCLLGLPFLNTKKGNLDKFIIRDIIETFQTKIIHRIVNVDVFKAPAALLKRGCNSDLSCVAAFSDNDLVFTNSVNALKSKKGDRNKLLNLTGLFNSDVYTYLNILTSASIAVERNETYQKEFLKFPYVYDEKIKNIADELQKVFTNENVNKLNSAVVQAFCLDDVEKDLIDYALNITVPIWKLGDNLNKAKKPAAFKDVKKEQLKEYTDIFCENFAEHYKYFNVDVYQFKYCTLINFKSREKKQAEPVINFIENSDLEKTIASIAPSEFTVKSVTNEIFVKKDMKGFEKDSFWVLKTNEYKNWHRAVARLDVNEFSNAIWEAELELSK